MRAASIESNKTTFYYSFENFKTESLFNGNRRLKYQAGVFDIGAIASVGKGGSDFKF